VLSLQIGSALARQFETHALVGFWADCASQQLNMLVGLHRIQTFSLIVNIFVTSWISLLCPPIDWIRVKRMISDRDFYLGRPHISLQPSVMPPRKQSCKGDAARYSCFPLNLFKRTKLCFCFLIIYVRAFFFWSG
jgi:hypothetical protein